MDDTDSQNDKNISPENPEKWEMGYDFELTRYRFGEPKAMLKMFKERKADFFMKKTTETTTIIWHKTRIIFTHGSAFPRNKMFLFLLVAKDAKKWCSERDRIVLPPRNQSIVYNLEYDDTYGVITGTDMNHAYWRIAFIKGIISQKTYEHGLDPSCKALRLATISVLGRKDKVVKYIKGEKQEIVTIKEGDEKLRKVYDYVRYYSYSLMKEMADLLGDDFESWNTDCIYYRQTPENIQKIHEYLDKRQMSYKQFTEY